MFQANPEGGIPDDPDAPWLDTASERVWRDGTPRRLTPRAFAVLAYLARHPDRLVTKDELLTAVWSGTIVGEAALTVVIGEIRRVLGDDARAPRFIETVHRRGFRLLVPLAVRRLAGVPARPSRLVGRSAELTRLEGWLADAAAGTRRVVLVTGEPGIGKSALVDAFVERAATRGDVWVARGQCVEHQLPPEPYLPVLEALGRLCRAPGGERLVTLLALQAPAWLARMPALRTAERTGTLARRASAGGTAQMLREGCDAIEAMAAERALVLVIDDLHWSDPATVDLLARLATRHGPSRLLVVGTYRPGDALRDGHPLTRVARELALHRWCTELALGPLDEADVRAYLEDLLGPDAMLPGLAGAIRRRTDGHPLFMVEVVADLARRGRLAKRGDRRQPTPEVAEADVPVPDTVRRLVEQTLDRLDAMSREILEVASVAGVDFPGAMVAAVLGLPAAAVDDACAELARQASFLRALGLDSPWSGAGPDLPTGTYRFLHALAREAVYDRIAPGRRAWLHRKLGELRERAGRTARAPELARHFLEGRDGIRAARYLRQAAAVAMRGRRHAEAIVHLRAAAAALSEPPRARRRARHELDVQVALGTVLMLVKGYAAPEVEVAFSRAQVLCHEVGNVPPPLPMLAGLWRYHQVAGNIGTAYDRARELLERGRREGDPSLLLEAHRAMGMTLCVRGEPLSGQAHLEAGARLYEPESHGALARETEWDAGVMCLRYGALALWTVGRPDQARQQALRAIELARRSAHAPSLVAALVVGARLFQFRREPGRVRELAGEGFALAREHGFALRAAAATMLLGWARSAEGEAAEGLATLRAGFRAYGATGARDDRPYWLALMAEATAESGDLATAQRLVDEGLALARTEGLRAWEADLLRLRGDLALRAASRHAPARAAAGSETALGQAVEVARSQAARTLELRAVTSLARLWQRRGRARTARDLLRRVYGEFGEGFDTADLRQARQVLEALPR